LTPNTQGLPGFALPGDRVLDHGRWIVATLEARMACDGTLRWPNAYLTSHSDRWNPVV
jgi:hypothetical protein